jgi:hypothetical protein
MKQYEYRMAMNCGSTKLNDLGKEGWELVAVTLCSSTYNRIFYFKREINGNG